MLRKGVQGSCQSKMLTLSGEVVLFIGNRDVCERSNTPGVTFLVSTALVRGPLGHRNDFLTALREHILAFPDVLSE